jgi:hypothetical protein
MLLYHGTSTLFLKKILEEGLTPREKNGNNTWEHNPDISPSKPEYIYLTSHYGYALFYAENACCDDVDAFPVVIEVDVDKENLFQDDDVQKIGEKVVKGAFSTDAKGSLQVLGTASHLGVIPVSRFKKIYVFLDMKYTMNFMSDVLSSTAYYVLSNLPATEKKGRKWLKNRLIELGGIKVFSSPFKIDFDSLKEVSVMNKTLADKYMKIAYPDLFKNKKKLAEAVS